MGFWVFMLVMDLLIPALLLFFGWLFLYHAPKKPSPFLGYRTSRSTKNLDTWAFANAYFAKWYWRFGWPTLVLTVIAMLAVLGRNTDTVAAAGGIICAVQFVPVLLPIPLTERALRRTFDKDGN